MLHKPVHNLFSEVSVAATELVERRANAQTVPFVQRVYRQLEQGGCFLSRQNLICLRGRRNLLVFLPILWAAGERDDPPSPSGERSPLSTALSGCSKIAPARGALALSRSHRLGRETPHPSQGVTTSNLPSSRRREVVKQPVHRATHIRVPHELAQTARSIAVST
jgi:hypothetical protein